MAASVAAVEGHRDRSFKWNSGLRPINASKRRYASIASSSDDRLRARGKPKEDNGNQSEESSKSDVLELLDTKLASGIWISGKMEINQFDIHQLAITTAFSMEEMAWNPETVTSNRLLVILKEHHYMNQRVSDSQEFDM